VQKMAFTLLILQLALPQSAGCTSAPAPVVSDIAASHTGGTDAIHDQIDPGGLDGGLELRPAAEGTSDSPREQDMPEVSGSDQHATDMWMPADIQPEDVTEPADQSAEAESLDHWEIEPDWTSAADSLDLEFSVDNAAAPDVVAEDISSQCGDCDDGIPCTVDQCQPLSGCKHIPDHSLCDDQDVCTWDACDENEGCIYDPSKLPCDDLDPCTLNDSCWSYECAGAPMECGPGHQCEDGQCVCQPDCEDTECGWDGCGSSCGECDPGWGCVWDSCVEGEAPCPPPAPYGTDVGDYIHPASLKSCTGALYSMHDLCTSKASWIFLFSGT
jgi:hypothetical protein